MNRTCIWSLVWIGILGFKIQLSAVEHSLTNDVFLKEIRDTTERGNLAEAKKMVRTRLAVAEAANHQMEQVVGNLYLTNLELLDGFDTNAASAAAAKMRVAAADLPRGTSQIAAAMLLDQIGISLIYAGQYADAEACLQWAYDIFANRAGPYNLMTSLIQGRLGGVQMARGNLKEATGNLKDAATNVQVSHVRLAAPAGYTQYRLGSSSAIAAQGFLSDYANLLRRQKKFRYEGNRLKEYLRFTKRCYGEDHGELVPILIRLGYNYESRDSRSSARKYFEQAIEIAERDRATHARIYWEALTHAHEYYRRSGQSADRERIAVKLKDEPGPPENQAQEAESLRSYLHSCVMDRLEEIFRREPKLRRVFILDEFMGQ